MKKILLNHNIIGYEYSLMCKIAHASLCYEHRKLDKIVHVHVHIFALNLFIYRLYQLTVIQLTFTFVSKEPEATNSP